MWLSKCAEYIFHIKIKLSFNRSFNLFSHPTLYLFITLILSIHFCFVTYYAFYCYKIKLYFKPRSLIVIAGESSKESRRFKRSLDPNYFVKINVTAPVETPSWSKLLELHHGRNHQSLRKRPGITLKHAGGMRDPIVGFCEVYIIYIVCSY